MEFYQAAATKEEEEKDFDSTLTGEENAFVFTVGFCFPFAFRIKSTPSSDKTNAFPLPATWFCLVSLQKQCQHRRLIERVSEQNLPCQ